MRGAGEAIVPFLVLCLTVGAIVAAAMHGNTDAKVASQNISTAADNFEISRDVVFYNGITGQYFAEVKGRCSIVKDNHDDQLEVTCKVGKDTYTKDYLGLSDNVTYFVLQTEPVAADNYHKRIIFKPSSIIPDVEFK